MRSEVSSALGLNMAAAVLVCIFVLKIVLRLTWLETFIVAMPFMFYVPLGATLNFSLGDVILPILALCAYRSRGERAGFRLVPRLSIALVWILLVSLMWNGLVDGAVSVGTGVVTVAKVVIGCLTGWAVLVTASESISRKDYRFVKVWVWTAFLISCLTVTDAVGLTSILGSLQGVRSLGTFEDPNLFATYLAVTIPFVLAPQYRVGPWLRAGQTLVVLVAIVATGSRGAFLAVAVAVLVLAVATFGSGVLLRTSMMGVIGLSLFGVILWGVGVQLPVLPGLERLTAVSLSNASDPRVELWSRAWTIWLDHPVLGIGPGQYEVLGGKVTHNTYLNFLAESGVLGFIAFFAFVLLAFRWAMRAGLFGRLLMVGVATLCVSMYSLNLQNVAFVWAYLGICLAAGVADRRKPLTRRAAARKIGQRQTSVTSGQRTVQRPSA